MPTVPQIRDALKAALATVAGLRAFDTVQDSLNPPAAVVGPPQIAYDVVMARGASRYTFPVRVYASRAEVKTGQDKLDGYISATGPTSIKLAVEADMTLGGVTHSARVASSSGYGVYEVAGIAFVGAEFTIEVIA